MKMHRWFALCLVLALGALFAATGAHAQGARRPAGYVTAVDAPDHDGKPGANLVREGLEYDVQIWTPLFSGDFLQVRGGGAVTIETTKDKRQRIDAGKSPYKIEGETPAGSRFAAIAATIGDLFKAKPANNAVNLVGRNALAPTVRIGGGMRQHVVSGAPIWIAWHSGVAPFTVEIRGQTGNRKREIGVLASTMSQKGEATLDIPASAKGTLSLHITDAKNQSARVWLVTTPQPIFPPEFSAANAPSPEYAKVASALYLLKQKFRAMEILAATQVIAIRDYPPAAALLRLLAEGRAI